ncbi:MAG: FAD-dependent monooxygenase [Pseudomonadota bacterium]
MDADVIIVGGGLNGPLLSLALASGGVRAVVLDALPVATRAATGFDGRAYALALASRRMLEALEVWPAVAGEAQPIFDIRVGDGRPGEGAHPWHVHFDHREIEEGPFGHMVEDRVLRPALLARMEALGIAHHAPVRVVDQRIEASRAVAILEDGMEVTGRVLIGCDGRDSAVAARAGIPRTKWGYDQTSLVAAIAHARPHEGTAHQLFMPSGPLAILPLPGNRSSIVWTEATARAAEIDGLDDAAYLAELRPRFGSFLGEIALAGPRFSYPLGLSLAQRFTGPRLALAGDAAHGIHNLAGQGLNLGFRDIAALAEVLIDARRRGEDIGQADVLARYQRWRRFDTTLLAVATDTINRVFSNDNPLLRIARDAALGLVGASDGARRGFMREAAGLTGTLPRLLQGRAI